MEAPIHDTACPSLLVRDGFSLVDFSYRGKSGRLQPFAPLHEKSQSILKSAENYLDILCNNGSIAKHQGIALFRDRIEARINESFTSSRPTTEQPKDNEKHNDISVHWMDLVHADISKLSASADGKYRYSIGEVSVVIPKEDRDTLCSAFLWKLLRSAEPEDLEKEQKARFSAMQDLIQLMEDMHQVSKVVEKSLYLLSGKSGNDNFEDPSFFSILDNQPLNCRMSPSSHKSDLMSISSRAIDGNEALANERPASFSDDDIALEPERNEGPQGLGGPSSNTRNSMRPKQRRNGRWDPSEKKNLADFLRGREGLTWQQQVDGYRRRYGSHRSRQSIRNQATRMGFDMPDGKKNSKIVKLKTPARPTVTYIQSEMRPAGAVAVNDIQNKTLDIEAYSEAQTRQSPRLSEASATRGNVGRNQPVEAALNVYLDDRDTQSYGLHREFKVTGHSSRGALEQLLN